MRRPRIAGGGSSCAHGSELSFAIIVAASAPRERGAAIGAWTASGRDCSNRRPARRRRDRRPGLLAVDLRGFNVPLLSSDFIGTHPRAWIPGQRAHWRAAGGLPRRRALRRRARGDRVRPDRAAALRLEQPRHPRSAHRRRGRVCVLPRVRAARRRADAAARALLAPQLRSRKRGDARHVRRTRDPVLLPHDLPAAGRRLHGARERAHDRPGDARHVRALAALRRTCRPTRPEGVHGRGAARGVVRHPAAAPHRAATPTTSPISCRHCSCSPSGCRSRSPLSSPPSSPTRTRATPGSRPRSTTPSPASPASSGYRSWASSWRARSSTTRSRPTRPRCAPFTRPS